jgi:hypothetical protein
VSQIFSTHLGSRTPPITVLSSALSTSTTPSRLAYLRRVLTTTSRPLTKTNKPSCAKSAKHSSPLAAITPAVPWEAIAAPSPVSSTTASFAIALVLTTTPLGFWYGSSSPSSDQVLPCP